MQSNTRNSHSHYYLLFQICWNKTHIKKLYHKSAEYSDSDWYINKYSVSDKMIHEATDSAAISTDRAAAVWENEDRWAERKTVR